MFGQVARTRSVEQNAGQTRTCAVMSWRRRPGPGRRTETPLALGSSKKSTAMFVAARINVRACLRGLTRRLHESCRILIRGKSPTGTTRRKAGRPDAIACAAISTQTKATTKLRRASSRQASSNSRQGGKPCRTATGSEPKVCYFLYGTLDTCHDSQSCTFAALLPKGVDRCGGSILCCNFRGPNIFSPLGEEL